MTSSTDIAAAIPRAARYAVERGARRETREDFERLAMLGDEAVEALVDQLRRSVQPPERALAALLAAKLPVEQALPRLADVVELEKDSDVLAAAAEALGELPGAASSQQLERLAGRGERDVRRAVAAALYDHDDAAAFGTLLELAHDPDPDTRGWAVWARADGFPAGERRDEALLAFLGSSPDSQLAARARGALEPASRPPLPVAPRKPDETASLPHGGQTRGPRRLGKPGGNDAARSRRGGARDNRGPALDARTGRRRAAERLGDAARRPVA